MLSCKEASKLLRLVKFKDDPPPPTDHHLAAAPKSERRALILHDEGAEVEERKSAAAIELQRMWRGFCVRCRLFEVLNDRASVELNRPLSSAYSRLLASQPSSHHRSVVTVEQSSDRQSRLQEYYKNCCQKAEERGEESITFEDFCAHFIQSWWHKVYTPRRLQGIPESRDTLPRSMDTVPKSMVTTTPIKSASSITKSVSIVLSPETGVVTGGEHTPGAPPPSVTKTESRRRSRKSVPSKKKRTEPLLPNEAAAIIQQAWRRHIDVQVYRYYRDLINFRCRGNPAMMLRCINPKEASLLDAAAGIHVKFRLAGVKFPPNIYYKIFTHRTIIDMCANSPKDYTRANTKRFAARDVHNRREQGDSPSLQGGDMEKTGWYQRVENNGWRLVSDRLILRADQDPVTWESSRTKQDFSHSKLQRREDVEKKKKRKKLEWMKKMYRDGMLQAQAEDEGLNTLVEDATDGLMAQLENKGPESVDDWEVDELLQWTSGLNFDDYQKSWQEIATSAGSETYIEERLQFKTSKQDPYEFTFTMRESLPSPPSPSRVTTAKSRSATTKLLTEDYNSELRPSLLKI